MNRVGIEVKPIRTIDGASTEINQVFFSDVEVPVEERLGEEGGGWGIANWMMPWSEQVGSAALRAAVRS